MSDRPRTPRCRGQPTTDSGRKACLGFKTHVKSTLLSAFLRILSSAAEESQSTPANNRRLGALRRYRRPNFRLRCEQVCRRGSRRGHRNLKRGPDAVSGDAMGHSFVARPVRIGTPLVMARPAMVVLIVSTRRRSSAMSASRCRTRGASAPERSSRASRANRRAESSRQSSSLRRSSDASARRTSVE